MKSSTSPTSTHNNNKEKPMAMLFYCPPSIEDRQSSTLNTNSSSTTTNDTISNTKISSPKRRKINNPYWIAPKINPSSWRKTPPCLGPNDSSTTLLEEKIQTTPCSVSPTKRYDEADEEYKLPPEFTPERLIEAVDRASNILDEKMKNSKLKALPIANKEQASISPDSKASACNNTESSEEEFLSCSSRIIDKDSESKSDPNTKDDVENKIDEEVSSSDDEHQYTITTITPCGNVWETTIPEKYYM